MKSKVLCIFTTLLGHRTEVWRFTEALNRIQDLECKYVLIDADDYRQFQPPWWTRLTSPWEFEFVSRQKARAALADPFDILLVNAWELQVEFAALAANVPAGVVLDCTPASIASEVRHRGLGGWRRTLAHQAHHRAYAKIADRFDVYFCKGSDCADSLYNDYKIPRERCVVTLAPHRLESWKPIARAYQPPLRLLFVGNDFPRKGGDLLLTLYRNHLAGRCTLTIVSGDPSLERERLPEGVTWLKGQNREQMLQLYQQSDVFVFPSQQDFVPESLNEALSVGLPAIVRDIPGVRDLVQHGENGLRIPRHAPVETWAAELLPLIANPAEIARMSAKARQFAEDKLSLEPFFRLVEDVMQRLCSLQATKGSHRAAKSTG